MKSRLAMKIKVKEAAVPDLTGQSALDMFSKIPVSNLNQKKN